MGDNLMLLVDGSSYLYRAFHAMPDLRAPDGVPTGAIHGMVAMMKTARPACTTCSTPMTSTIYAKAWENWEFPSAKRRGL